MEEKIGFTKTQKVCVAIGIGVSVLIAYKFGIKHEDKLIAKGIARMWIQDPELQPKMWDAIKKIEKK